MYLTDHLTEFYRPSSDADEYLIEKSVLSLERLHIDDETIPNVAVYDPARKPRSLSESI